MLRPTKDMVFGGLALGVAAAYWHAADDIQRSFLADEVGADGVPKLLAGALAALGALVVLREVATRRVRGRPTGDAPAGRPHRRALGLLALASLYVALMPWLGYFVATAALIAGIALYAGQALSRTLLVTAVAGSLVLWVVFDRMLSVSLPPGFWARLLA